MLEWTIDRSDGDRLVVGAYYGDSKLETPYLDFHIYDAGGNVPTDLAEWDGLFGARVQDGESVEMIREIHAVLGVWLKAVDRYNKRKDRRA